MEGEGGDDGTGEKGPMTEQFRQGRWGYRNARVKRKGRRQSSGIMIQYGATTEQGDVCVG